MAAKKRKKNPKPPIKHWSHSSLMAYLRNPFAWHTRYVEKVFDMPTTPSAAIGRAGHKALEHFYGGIAKEGAIELGLEYLRGVPDFELNFGAARSRRAKKEKRQQMERDYLQAVQFYLDKAPKHKVVGIEVRGTAHPSGFRLPLKAISDLVVESRVQKGAVDVVDHKFVQSFSSGKGGKTAFILQALFNYYTVSAAFGKPVRRFIVQECKKRRNADGSPQMRRYVLDFATLGQEFVLFQRLINDATAEISRQRVFLPNPSDMFDGEHSFEIYRLGLTD